MVSFEHVRKIMGWCPNAGAIEAKRQCRIDNIMANAPDRGGELTQIPGRWENKYRNLVLIQSLTMSIISICVFILWGRYESDYILNIITYAVVIGSCIGIFEWQKMNKAPAGYFNKPHETKMRKFTKYFAIIFTLIMIGTGIYALAFTKIDFKNLSPFFLGFSLSFWALYFLVVFWERKNRKILFQHGASFYAVDAGEMNKHSGS